MSSCAVVQWAGRILWAPCRRAKKRGRDTRSLAVGGRRRARRGAVCYHHAQTLIPAAVRGLGDHAKIGSRCWRGRGAGPQSIVHRLGHRIAPPSMCRAPHYLARGSTTAMTPGILRAAEPSNEIILRPKWGFMRTRGVDRHVTARVDSRSRNRRSTRFTPAVKTAAR